jgi:Asp-tRNA(Asn)/Glu-tRNA(Gln) amidotransferase C subunit
MQNESLVMLLIFLVINILIEIVSSYLKTKGQNLATKEDIEEITSKVEIIKNELSYSHEAKMAFSTQTKEAVIDTYEKLNLYLNEVYRVDLSKIRLQTHGSQFEKIRSDVDLLGSDFEKSYARLQLFLDNNDLLSKFNQLNTLTLTFNSFVSEKMFDFQEAFIEYSGKIISAPSDEIEFVKNNSKFVIQFISDRYKLYTEIDNFNFDFRREIRSHLVSL